MTDIIDFTKFKNKKAKNNSTSTESEEEMPEAKVYLIAVVVSRPNARPQYCNLLVKIESEINSLESLFCQMADDTIKIHQEVAKQIEERYATDSYTILNIINLGIDMTGSEFKRVVTEFNQGKDK